MIPDFKIPKGAKCLVCGSQKDLIVYINQPMPDEKRDVRIWYYCKKCHERKAPAKAA